MTGHRGGPLRPAGTAILRQLCKEESPASFDLLLLIGTVLGQTRGLTACC